MQEETPSIEVFVCRDFMKEQLNRAMQWLEGHFSTERSIERESTVDYAFESALTLRSEDYSYLKQLLLEDGTLVRFEINSRGKFVPCLLFAKGRMAD